jgi:23S rRNA (guanosine2251-2'-O)-methyltransferase
MQYYKENKSKPDPALILIGRNPIVEAIKDGKEIEKIFIQANLRGEYEKEIRHLSKDLNIPLVKVPPEKLNALSGNKNHQGILAFISPIKFQQLSDVIPHIFGEGKTPCIFILESVSDVRNLAAISRSAYVMGVDAIVITSKNSARINEDTVKISAGAILNIPVCREKNMIEVLKILKENGIKIFSTDLTEATPVDKVDFNIPCAVVMGDEHSGVTLETLRESDERIKIPQYSDFDSLNVSVAAGIIMYEVGKQRNQ